MIMTNVIKVILILFLNLKIANSMIRHQYYSERDIFKKREEVREMFQHAYNGYIQYASGYDELRPLTCDGINTWGSYSLTLIDGLDTLAIMGNNTEFVRVVNYLIQNSNFDADINVSVFETNIRIVGGLLSAHLFSRKTGLDLELGWPCNGPLLRMAEDVARRLLPAFDTKTGMPYGTVNLRYGVPAGETPITCTAGVGTFLVEFGALSRLTGDPIYEEIALNAVYSLWKYRSPIGLFGNHIDVQTGRWIAQDAGIGAGVDSFFEYLVKGSVMLNRPDLLKMFHESRAAIDKYLKKDDWYIWASMNKGQVTLPVFQSLEAFWPGVLALIGDLTPAIKTFNKYHSVWKQYGFLPEFYNIPNLEATRESYPLRPELVESAMLLYRATKDSYFLEVGNDMLTSIQHSARTNCGYSTIRNVRTHERENRMESFFLAETTKYLYLLFDQHNFIHNDGSRGTVIETPNGQCIIEAGNYIFNTEAHPIDPSALHCCLPKKEIFKDLNFNNYLGKSLDAQQRKFLQKEIDNKKNCSARIQPRNANITIDIEFEMVEETVNTSTDFISDKFAKQMKLENKNANPLETDLWVLLKDILTKKFDEYESNQGVDISTALKAIMKKIEINDSLLEKNVALHNLTRTLNYDKFKSYNLYEFYLLKIKKEINADAVHELEFYQKSKIENKHDLQFNDILNFVSKILRQSENSLVSCNNVRQINLEEDVDSSEQFNTMEDFESTNHNTESLEGKNSLQDTESNRNLENNEITLEGNHTFLKYEHNIAVENEEIYETDKLTKHYQLENTKLNRQIITDLIKILCKCQRSYVDSLNNSTKLYEFIVLYLENINSTNGMGSKQVLNILKEIELKISNFDETVKLKIDVFDDLIKLIDFKQKITDTLNKFTKVKLSSHKMATNIPKIKNNELEKDVIKSASESQLDDDIIVIEDDQDIEIGVGSIEPISSHELITKQEEKKNDDGLIKYSNILNEDLKTETINKISEPIPPKYIDETENSSILTDFVQSILKTTSLLTKQKFDSQVFLDRIRENPSYMHYDENGEVFTCKAPNFIDKFFVNGLI